MVRIFLTLLALMTPLSAANIGLLIMATGKYIQFVPPLIESANKYFCTDHHITYYVFTDGQLPPADNIIQVYQARMGWPYDTMKRYHTYAANKDLYQKEDYLFAVDADMLFVGKMGDEILGKRVATIHPGFYNKKRGTYETRKKSTAYIGSKEGKHYFAGGFYGGSTQEFIKIVSTNAQNIDRDLKRKIIAVWHDESHWNRYCINNPPTVVLSPSYCYPEGWNLPFEPKLIALNKNHKEVRSP